MGILMEMAMKAQMRAFLCFRWRNFSVENTKEGVFVLLNGVLWGESTDKGDFVLSMEGLEIGCAVEWAVEWCIAECSVGSNVGRTVTGKYGRRSLTLFSASSA